LVVHLVVLVPARVPPVALLLTARGRVLPTGRADTDVPTPLGLKDVVGDDDKVSLFNEG
jgi:hypothetical protein